MSKWIPSGPTKHKNVGERVDTWRIIPFRNWLITMVSKSPNWGSSLSKWPKWLVNGGDPNY